VFDSWTLHLFLYYIITTTITVTESVGCLSDFHWLCLLELCWCLIVISSGLAADLLLVHQKSLLDCQVQAEMHGQVGNVTGYPGVFQSNPLQSPIGNRLLVM